MLVLLEPAANAGKVVQVVAGQALGRFHGLAANGADLIRRHVVHRGVAVPQLPFHCKKKPIAAVAAKQGQDDAAHVKEQNHVNERKGHAQQIQNVQIMQQGRQEKDAVRRQLNHIIRVAQRVGRAREQGLGKAVTAVNGNAHALVAQQQRKGQRRAQRQGRSHNGHVSSQHQAQQHERTLVANLCRAAAVIQPHQVVHAFTSKQRERLENGAAHKPQQPHGHGPHAVLQHGRDEHDLEQRKVEQPLLQLGLLALAQRPQKQALHRLAKQEQHAHCPVDQKQHCPGRQQVEQEKKHRQRGTRFARHSPGRCLT